MKEEEKKNKAKESDESTDTSKMKEGEGVEDTAKVKESAKPDASKTEEELKTAAEPDTGAEEKAPEAGDEYREPRFMDVVFSVSAGALQGLGLGIPAPEGEKFEPNLDLARYSIDMLELLKLKTEGKLDAEEGKFLSEMLHSLRLKYLEVANQAKEAK